MNAGYETTASALAFTVANVAATPAAEAQLLREVDAFGRKSVPSYEDLDKVRTAPDPGDFRDLRFKWVFHIVTVLQRDNLRNDCSRLSMLFGQMGGSQHLRSGHRTSLYQLK